MAIHSSILAWKIPWTEESMGLQRVRHDRAHTYIVHGVSEFGFENEGLMNNRV